MQTEITQTIVQKIPQLTEEQQRKMLEIMDKMLEEQKPSNIWQRLDDRLAQVPAAEVAELSADASENLDHYLYGTPKKNK